MLISPAWAHGSLARADDAHGGGTALLIILAGVIAVYLVYRSRKKSRKRKLQHNDGGE